MMYWNHKFFRMWAVAAFFVFAWSFGAAQQIDSATGAAAPARAQQQGVPAIEAGHITGTVQDTYGDVVAGATVVLDDGTITDQRSVDTNDSGFFQFSGV